MEHKRSPNLELTLLTFDATTEAEADYVSFLLQDLNPRFYRQNLKEWLETPDLNPETHVTLLLYPRESQDRSFLNPGLKEHFQRRVLLVICGFDEVSFFTQLTCQGIDFLLRPIHQELLLAKVRNLGCLADAQRALQQQAMAKPSPAAPRPWSDLIERIKKADLFGAPAEFGMGHFLSQLAELLELRQLHCRLIPRLTEQKAPLPLLLDPFHEEKGGKASLTLVSPTALNDISDPHAPGLAVALQSRGQPRGLLLYEAGGLPWPDNWREEIMALAGQVLVGYLDQRDHYQAIHSLDTMMLYLFLSLIDKRPCYSAGDHQRAAAMAVRTGRLLKMSESELLTLHRAMTLRDLGYHAIDEAILSKPGPLTPQEFQQIQRHPEHSAELASRLPYPPQVVQAIRCHHEHFDGSGYPRRLHGEEIPLVSRIILVVESFVAMNKERPYSQRKGAWTAMEELRRLTPSHYDPLVVHCFTQIAAEEREKEAPFFSPLSKGRLIPLQTNG